ncbi:MAG: hypothetical protein F6K36_09450 [Symploca sp. SIO3C6]|uniref:Uncharacterized protein n=1 Tax=Symploca sp. SIO1C4 TaxID=2607765 RepID=A0A6B3N3N4_9CYAN|nr:hypothetical protein [Symploca sp. SIO3C6]NER26110.1 hypothetical protein [Symploca sp. SIO1C4]NET05563.1 hypothetical protein [Symploca sp. SIO2B6]NET53652.1 hypothetical protein [Merismopedia sp. SIO2A8]
MDEVVKKVAALGLPGVILVVAMATSGAMGGIGLISTIAGFGGPLGLAGGLAFLGLMTGVGDIISGYGIDAVLKAVYEERKKKESISSLRKEVKELPISENLRFTLLNVIQSGSRSVDAEDMDGPKTVEIIED